MPHRLFSSILALLSLSLSLCACGSSKPDAARAENKEAWCGTGDGDSDELVVAVPKGEVKKLSLDSKALGVRKNYWVYLPADYESSETRYPVIYMLHGLGGSESNWVDLMKLNEAADKIALQAIVVMPDGDNSFYVNSTTKADYDTCLSNPRRIGSGTNMSEHCVKSAMFEDYITNDLVSHIDSTLRTLPVRESRAIGGLSMGGYGALMLAMRHKDIYSSTASHSGVDTLLYAGPYPYEKGKSTLASDAVTFTARMGPYGPLFLSIFGEDIENWRTHDPANLAQELSDGELSIYLDCGTEDDFRLHNGASYLHEVLDAKAIKHSFTLLSGAHNVAFWTDRIDDSLRFHSEHFSKTQAP